MKIRRPAVAGYFYPADRDALGETVTSLLDAAVPHATTGPGKAPGWHKAVVAPHAGYIYSGPIAATAYRWLEEAGEDVERVILVGPAHRVPFRGLAASGADAFETPLGLVEVDREAVGRALSLPCVRERDEAHEPEHSLEVHLPFLQRSFSAFRLVPLVVGDAEPADVETALRLLWGGPETSIVVSSDLSHYLDYDSARREDRATASAIEALRPQDIGPTQACGAVAVQGLLGLAAERGLRVRTLDLRNSGDTAGPKDRVVGYGAFAFEEA
jgi:AmmeMemoRadiSam system protein B